jgi:bifunctional non-homologous end joining protein LigD
MIPTSMKQRNELDIDGQTVSVTSPTKPLWPDKSINKVDYLQYLHDISDYMLPFMKERSLTIIRYPHGIEGESFYQKNCPDYAPDFIKTHVVDDINYIVCSDLASLMWLGNQLAFELHVPFETIHSKGVSEIVFDLDPPSRNEFQLAIEAAFIIKDILDKLKLTSFIKTSGNKGLQVYIPLPENKYSYEETRRFTAFVAAYLTEKEPEWFTTERLKKNRGKKLYVDYLQHAEGKTIIAPYSARGNPEALVATPLFWEEIARDLRPEQFPLESAIDRLKKKGCPFNDFFKAKKNQRFAPVLGWLSEQGL